jgi:1-acyl-sn-glycerol-3-phosphate acyltransferase
MMPPRRLRRPLTITAWSAIAVTCVALSPVLLLLAWLASTVSGRPQPLVFTRLLVAYLAQTLFVLAACGLLWVLSGGGRLIDRPRFQLAHWRLLRWFARRLATIIRSVLQIDEEPDESAEAERALESDGPVLVFSRHAGPGDTFLILDRLMSRFDRPTSVVLKDTWALEPSVDLLAHRLPHAMLDTSDREKSVRQIEQVASKLGRRGALLLFPEGANFTPERRRRVLASLRRKGRRRAAARAQEMSNVLPPRPTGALAAIRGNPEADVIFASHTGLGLAAYPAQLWRDMPIGRTFRTRMWHVPASDVPADSDEQTAWINRWWRRIDDWIEAQQ